MEGWNSSYRSSVSGVGKSPPIRYDGVPLAVCCNALWRNCGITSRTGLQVAYLDPGNWATAIESGSRFGYRQLWVLVLANLIAIQLQTLSSRLGLVSGKHLAQVCRDSYPPIVCRLLWIMTEISIVALDLTMVLGAWLPHISAVAREHTV